MGSKTVGFLVLFFGAMSAMSLAHLVAHHAVTDVYDEEKTMTIVGTVERVVDRMPHPSVELVVKRQGAGERTWAVEFDAARRLIGSATEAAATSAGRPRDRVRKSRSGPRGIQITQCWPFGGRTDSRCAALSAWLRRSVSGDGPSGHLPRTED